MTEEQTRALMLRMHLDPFCSLKPRFLGVVDTNALLSSAENDCRNPGWRSRLLLMTDDGTAKLFAADHVYSEMYEHLPRYAQAQKVPPAILRSRFEEHYLPALRFVTVDTTAIVDPQVLAITDDDDVPSGQLAKLIAPCVVFSGDKHLRRPGLAPDDWHVAARFAIDLIEGATKERVTMNAASLPVAGGVELVKFLGRRTNISPWLWGLVMVGGTAWLLRTPERRKVAGKYLVPMVEEIGRQLEYAAALEQRGLQGLREAILAVPDAPSLKQQTAIMLARRSAPLTAPEIQQLFQRHFPSTVPTVAEVRAVLRDGPEFFQPERYRWQFGREAAPWHGK